VRQAEIDVVQRASERRKLEVDAEKAGDPSGRERICEKGEEEEAGRREGRGERQLA
jgi:hypothetical protein